MIKKLQQVDARFIYLALVVSLVIPMFSPLSLPFAVDKTSQSFYETIDALAPGSVVVFSFNYSPGGRPQLDPQALVIAKHLFNKQDIKVVFNGFYTTAPQFAEDIIKQLDEFGKVYGEDYVNLGYKAGAATAISTFGKDVHKTFPRDARGTKISDIPMMANIKTADDFDLIITLDTGGPGRAQFIQQIQGAFGTAIAAGVTSVNVANTMPYYSAGQLCGLLDGLRGAAEYEKVSGFTGAATISMDSMSTGHVMIIVLILIGNMAYFLDPERGSKRR